MSDSASNHIAEQIEQNFAQIENDQEAATAFRQLDVTEFQDAAYSMLEKVSVFLNIESQRRSLQRIKAGRGRLDSETEASFVEHLAQGARAYGEFLVAGDRADKAMTACGLDVIISRYSKTFFWHVTSNPRAPHLEDLFRNVGATDRQISQFTELANSNDWDLLRLHGANGTFRGLLDVASQEMPRVQDMVSAVRAHGLPTIEGASSDSPWWVPVIIFVAAAAICIIGAVTFNWWTCAISAVLV